jgi:hypothetical protein
MTSEAVPAGGDPHRLLADARDLARRVRLAQRVTWLPLLALAVVMLGAIPVYLLTRPVLSDCRPQPDGQVCKAWYQIAQYYWWSASVLAYAAIAVGYLRVARSRGLGTRVLPYVLTGVGLVVLSAVAAGSWALLDYPYYPDGPPAFINFLFRLTDPTGAFGIALLVLAWLERRAALLVFAAVYLVVILVPINFGWEMRSQWQFVPQLVINAAVLLLGSAGFALAQRRAR